MINDQDYLKLSLMTSVEKILQIRDQNEIINLCSEWLSLTFQISYFDDTISIYSIAPQIKNYRINAHYEQSIVSLITMKKSSVNIIFVFNDYAFIFESILTSQIHILMI